MSAEDVNEITNEMTNEELDEEETEEGMSDLEAFLEGEEEEYEDEDDEDEDDVPISKVITEIAQPVKVITSVGAEIDSKGQLKPNCKFTIERNITEDDNEYEIMATDFDALIDKVKATIAALKGGN